MKRTNKWLALGLALLVCLSTLWGCGEKAPQLKDDKTDDMTDQNEQPTSLSDTIVCCDGDRTLRFTKNEQDAWVWKDDVSFPLDTTYVDRLLATIEEMLTLQPITTDDTLEELGLADEEKYVTVSNEKGERITWYLGDKEDNGRYYMRRADDETGAVYLSPADLSAQISRSIYDMMVLPQLPALSADNIRSITIVSGSQSKQLQTNSAGKWVCGLSDVSDKALPLIEQLASWSLDSCVDYKPSSGAAAICGFSETSPTVTLEYVNTVDIGSTLVLTVGGTRGSGYCVTLDDSDTIYLLDAAVVDSILAFIQ